MDSKDNFVLLGECSQPCMQARSLEVEGGPHADGLPEGRGQVVRPAAASPKLLQCCKK